jgi:nucleotide-binding universal stress UspA family protein
MSSKSNPGYRTMIVPLDGSEYSQRALITATTLARATGAQLVLVRAASASVLLGVDASEAQLKVIHEAEAYLTKWAGRLDGMGFRVETAVPFMPAHEGILLEINQHHAGLVVMCTHGRSGVGRWIYGSVAEKILADSPVPVLLVRPNGPVGPLLLGSSQAPLLVPLDGSCYAEAALPHALALSQALDRELLLLRVVVPVMNPVSSPGQSWALAMDAEEMVVQEEQDQQMAEDYLDNLVGRLKSEGRRVKSKVRFGWPAEEIQEESKAAGAGMIVMATHGHTGLRGAILGSVALEMVHRGLLPLFLVHPTELADTHSELVAEKK